MRLITIERLNHPILGYEAFPYKAKEAQCQWMQENYDVDIEPQTILYLHSVIASLNVAIKAFTDIGDEVLVQPPVYPPFYSSIANNNRIMVSNPLKMDQDGKYSFDFDDLESKITPKTKLLLFCSPHNPVGRVWEKEELERLAYSKGKPYRDGLLVHLNKNITKLDTMLIKYSNLITFKKPQASYLIWLDCRNMGMNNKKLKEFFIHKAKLG